MVSEKTNSTLEHNNKATGSTTNNEVQQSEKKPLIQKLIRHYEIINNQDNKIPIDVYLLFTNPYIEIVYDLLSPVECETIIQIGDLCGWSKSKTSIGAKTDNPNNYRTIESNNRTSYTAKIEKVTDEEKYNFVYIILNRIASIFKLPLLHMEEICLLKYLPGQEFKIHHDGAFRTHSAIIYLNDVHKGGETYLPNIGIQFKPKCGVAICWKNLLDNGEVDTKTLHGSLPVIEGVKYCIPIFVNKQKMRSE